MHDWIFVLGVRGI